MDLNVSHGKVPKFVLDFCKKMRFSVYSGTTINEPLYSYIDTFITKSLKQ